MRKWIALFSLVLIAACLFPLTAVAQDSAELLARMRAMEDRIKSLEAEVQTLRIQQAAAPAAPAVTPAPAVAQAALEAVAPQYFSLRESRSNGFRPAPSPMTHNILRGMPGVNEI